MKKRRIPLKGLVFNHNKCWANELKEKAKDHAFSKDNKVILGIFKSSCMISEQVVSLRTFETLIIDVW